MQKIPETYAVVDVETTGGSPGYSRILEIAIFRIKHGVVEDSLVTLVDPGEYIPDEITNLTGITADSVQSSPSFRQISEKVCDLLDGAVFVAHNARFDYAFVRSELKRLDIDYSARTLCTARLFRALNPGRRHYNLDELINFYDLQCDCRHRAGGDAKVLVDFLQTAVLKHGLGFWSAVEKILDRPSWPAMLSHIKPGDLPETSGVYIFKSADGLPIYVGKANNIRSRVMQHFASDKETKELKIGLQTADIEYRITAGELGALMLESKLIKELLPVYNIKLRQGQKLIAGIKGETNGYPTFEIAEVDPASLQPDQIIGVFKSKSSAKKLLIELANKHRLCPKLLGVQTGSGACFWRSLEMCDGACEQLEAVWKYQAKFNEAFGKLMVKQWPFEKTIDYTEENEHIQAVWKINNWIVESVTLTSKDHDSYVQEYPASFDWDTYLILKKFLLK